VQGSDKIQPVFGILSPDMIVCVEMVVIALSSVIDAEVRDESKFLVTNFMSSYRCFMLPLHKYPNM